MLDPTLEQDNADRDEEVPEEHPDYIHIDHGQLENDPNVTQVGIYRKIDIPDDATLRANTRHLDCYQRQVINIGLQYAKDIVKARKEGNGYPSAPLIMVHGGAGAGKSTVSLLNGCRKYSRKKEMTLNAHF